MKLVLAAVSPIELVWMGLCGKDLSTVSHLVKHLAETSMVPGPHQHPLKNRPVLNRGNGCARTRGPISWSLIPKSFPPPLTRSQFSPVFLAMPWQRGLPT